MENFIHSLNDLIWSPPLVGLCLLAGLFFSLRSRFVQLRMIPEMWRLLFQRKEGEIGLSSFQALTLTLAGRVGTGIADEQEAYRAVMELAKKGHRRIAALTADPDDSSISQLRYSGYARALRELGIPPEEEDVICADDFTVESGCRAMRERLKRPADFTAVFAIADDMAIGAMRALRESGRSIPEDCSIIAIDGINVSEYIHPMLTTLCQPMTAMGTKSVELLLGVIRGGAHDHLTLPTTLRAGESVRDLTK